MRKNRYVVTAATTIWMVIGLGMTAQAKSAYRLEIKSQYDSQGVSRDDNDKGRIHPLKPDVYVSKGDSDAVEMLSGVSWSKSPENWTAGSDMTGAVYLGGNTGLIKSSLEVKMINGHNDVQITSVKKYTGSDYEMDHGYVYTVKSIYQIVAQLDSTTRAGWDSDNPFVAAWNSVKFANTCRVVLCDGQESVVSQVVEGAIFYDFSPFMTKSGTAYYFEVTAIARNGNQRDCLEDGEPVSSLPSQLNGPGVTDDTWEDYQQGRRFTCYDGTVAADKWERIMSKRYYFSPEGYAVTGWNELGGKWYYVYQDGPITAGTTTPDGYRMSGSGAWVQQTIDHVRARVNA